MKKNLTLLAAGSLLLPLTLLAADKGGEKTTNSATSGGAQIQVLRESQLQEWTMAEELSDLSVINLQGDQVGRVHGISLGALGNGAKQSGSDAQIVISLENEAATETNFLSIPPSHFTFDQKQKQLELALEMQALPSLLSAGFGGSRATEGGAANTASRASTERAAADAEDAALNPENTIAPVAVAAPSGTSTDLSVSNTGVEIDKIKDALEKDEQTSRFASEIGVLSATDSVLITGTVKDKDQREQVLRVVRSATEREVQDLMAVSETAAE